MTSPTSIPSQASVGPASLQSLPAEIKLMIMMRLHNKPSLRNIIQASATFREIYRNNDEAIYTAITIRSLARRGFDVFSQVNALEFYMLRNKWSDSDITWAVRDIYTICQQHKSSHARDSIRCPVEACTVALHILHAVAYNLPNVMPMCAAATAVRRSKYANWVAWAIQRYPYGELNYRVIRVINGS